MKENPRVKLFKLSYKFMQAALFLGPGKLEIYDYSLPPLGDDELLVKVGACGVCGTDFHIYNGEAPAKAPVIIGHEYSGEVLEIGKSVKEYNVGDRVAINPNIHCGYCEYCKQGRIHLCQNLRALGVTLNGGFAQISVVPQAQAYKIPNNFPYYKAAFAEPLSCCLHGIDQADIKFSDNVIIVGAGTIGLLMLQLTRLKGAKKVVVLDPIDSKRNLALKLKADYVIDPFQADFELNEIFPGGADVVIECVGSQSAAEMSLNFVKKGGRLILFGLSGPSAKLTIPLQSFFHKELTIKSSLLNPFTFQAAVDLLINNKINVEVINPNLIPLDSSALKSLFTGIKDASVIKYMIKPN